MQGLVLRRGSPTALSSEALPDFPPQPWEVVLSAACVERSVDAQRGCFSFWILAGCWLGPHRPEPDPLLLHSLAPSLIHSLIPQTGTENLWGAEPRARPDPPDRAPPAAQPGGGDGGGQTGTDINIRSPRTWECASFTFSPFITVKSS